MFQNVELFVGHVPPLNRHMAVLRLTPEQTRRPNFIHTVLVLDCSMSMSGSLESVKADTRQFVAELDDTDYVSIVVFSGHGRAALLSGPTRCDNIGKQLLDKVVRERVHIMDTTVFSEPLELVLDCLSRNRLPGMASQAVLFTDGCAVPTRWSVEMEQDKACTAAYHLREFGATVSGIGYGYHYDPVFSARLMLAGGSSGVFRHMSDVEDFSEVIRDIRSTFDRLDRSDIKLEVLLGGSGVAVTGVYRALPEVVQVSTNTRVASRGFYDGALTLYLDVTGQFDSANVQVMLDGNSKLLSPDARPLTPELQAECVRVTAAHLALTGHNAEAIELLEQTDDEAVAESLAEAYTERDRRTTADRIRRAFRHKRFIGAGLKPTGPNHCILNVLRALTEDPAVVLSIPAGAYKRGGQLTKDPRVVASPLGSTVRVVNYTSLKDRLNFSVVTQKDVKVRPVDDEGNILLDAAPVSSVVHRTYNLVRDGELVMPVLYASMSEATFSELQVAGVIPASMVYQPDRSYELNFGDMKMVSSAWARPAGLRLADLLCEEADLMAEQTALNARAKALGKVPASGFDGGVYRERSQVVEDVEVEYYSVPIVEVRLMKYKAAYVDDTAQLSLDETNTRLKAVQDRLRTVRWLARSIVFACHLTGWKTINWGPPQKAVKSDKSEQLAMLDGHQLKLVTGCKQVAAS